MDGRIFHLTKLLKEKLDCHWSVEEMAEIVGLSATHLQKLSKYETGMPPMAYLNKLRLDRAYSILSDPKSFEQVKEIMVKCGFMDESNFTRAFKRKYGMTPTECRHKAWEVEQSQLGKKVEYKR